jgi:hypothetical protein
MVGASRAVLVLAIDPSPGSTLFQMKCTQDEDNITQWLNPGWSTSYRKNCYGTVLYMTFDATPPSSYTGTSFFRYMFVAPKNTKTRNKGNAAPDPIHVSQVRT